MGGSNINESYHLVHADSSFHMDGVQCYPTWYGMERDFRFLRFIGEHLYSSISVHFIIFFLAFKQQYLGFMEMVAYFKLFIAIEA